MSGQTCSIVMYHYVRDLSKSRYPDINALRTEEFNYQLDYLESNYSLVSMADLQTAIQEGDKLPSNPALLTFDDGFIDHYTTVFPELYQRNIPGLFFPPAEPIRNDSVLNVHKIHYLLASTTDIDALIESVFDSLDDYREEYDLEPNQAYYNRLAEPGRWDPAEIIFVKRLLQRDLDYEVRSKIIDGLFDKYVNVPEKVLSEELYMKPNHLRTMIDSGMDVGGHGVTHRWMESLSKDEQRREIEGTVEFLNELNAPVDNWVMCYPYGSYNDTTLELVQEMGCTTGVTTEPDEAILTKENGLTLERLDTNDLPQSPNHKQSS